MCGRYATSRSSADLSELFDAVDETQDAVVPNYNVAPTDRAPVVRLSDRVDKPVISLARWGLVPPWAKDLRVGSRMINARAETLAGSSAYARPFARRRCLVPADGWFEWLRRASGKQAYFMTPADGSTLAFAGLWTSWRGPGAPERVVTFSIVTTVAVGDLAFVHDRMPLVLPPARWSSWLTGQPGADLLAPTPEEFAAGLEIRPVGPAVGDVRNNDPSLLARVDALPLTEPTELRLF
ncbi:MAG: SOS response-associated peptidase [Micromonosporaceae bacterium]|jgi:putative SOS response-associated peptidase YedK|nr:SOS response-associated peptidase [Micromonosporaceae bacterium]